MEIGIGNGYFMPLLLRKKSGQVPEKIALTDVSYKNIEIAKKHFFIKGTIYQKLDIYKRFSIEDQSVDLIVSNLVFNEVGEKGLINGFAEIKRILQPDGGFVVSVLHPGFIAKQLQRGVIKNNLMTSKNGMKIPTVKRQLKEYQELLSTLEFKYEIIDIFGNKKLFNKKTRLKEIQEVPIALLILGRSS